MAELSKSRHVTVVGGPGAMGRYTVRMMTQFDQVGTIVLADIDVVKARRFADEIGDKASAVELDVRDESRLNEVFAETDIVVNAMGPFVTFGKAILQAAIRNGCDYIDIDDDWQATVEALELDAEARAAGVTAVINVGMSPGVTNLLAVMASKELDSVKRIYTGWSLRGTGGVHEPEYDVEGGGTAAVAHWILQTSGQVQAWRNGVKTMVDPLEVFTIEFPDRAPQQVYSLGHPEPVTLPLAFPALDESLNVMTGPAWMFEGVREIAREFEADKISLEEAVARVGQIERPADPAATPRDQMPGSWALAEGVKNSETVTVGAYLSAVPPFLMGGSTGYALAAGLLMMLDGLVTEHGVLTPEQALDPIAFFDRLARMVEPVKHDAADLVTIVSHPRPAITEGK